MLRPMTTTEATKALSANDYEEMLLLESIVLIQRETFDKVDQLGLESRDPKEYKKVVEAASERISEHEKKLGYLPGGARPSRSTGRPRTKSMPNPMPDVGTELQSCLGEMYKIVGYGRSPTAKSADMIIYDVLDVHGRLKLANVCRVASNLFTGTLPSGIPFATWPGDPRGIKPEKPIPLNKRRTLTKAELQRDEHADPEAPGVWVKPKGRY